MYWPKVLIYYHRHRCSHSRTVPFHFRSFILYGGDLQISILSWCSFLSFIFPTSVPMAQTWDDGSDRPSTNSSNEQPEHAAHIRSRSIAHAHSPKRLSVFSGRSRSNTTTSTSSRRSPAASMDVSSSEERTTSALGIRSDKDKPSRSFLARGSRILRRQGSKINIVSTLDEEDEADREKPRSEREIFGRRSRHADNSKSDLPSR